MLFYCTPTGFHSSPAANEDKARMNSPIKPGHDEIKPGHDEDVT